MKELRIEYFLLLTTVWSLTRCQNPQPNVVSRARRHSLMLSLWFKSDADLIKCAQPLLSFPNIIHKVSDNSSDCANSIVAGVGFASKLYTQLDSHSSSFQYEPKQGNIGAFPATGGDIFVHAKSNSQGRLFELTQEILSLLPPGADCLQRFEDIYTFEYKNNRDLSGFIDGIQNPSFKKPAIKMSLKERTAGSYALSQRWEHNLKKIYLMTKKEKEYAIGRKMTNGRLLYPRANCSHVAKMESVQKLKKEYGEMRIYRQGGAYGSVSSTSGLFFLAFAKSLEPFKSMTDVMVGRDGSKVDDCVFLLSKCLSGNYWFFPGKEQLMRLKFKWSPYF